MFTCRQADGQTSIHAGAHACLLRRSHFSIIHVVMRSFVRLFLHIVSLKDFACYLIRQRRGTVGAVLELQDSRFGVLSIFDQGVCSTSRTNPNSTSNTFRSCLGTFDLIWTNYAVWSKSRCVLSMFQRRRWFCAINTVKYQAEMLLSIPRSIWNLYMQDTFSFKTSLVRMARMSLRHLGQLSDYLTSTSQTVETHRPH